jgi:antitoxin FitA
LFLWAPAQSLFQTRKGLKADHRKSEDTRSRYFSTPLGGIAPPSSCSAIGLCIQIGRLMAERREGCKGLRSDSIDSIAVVDSIDSAGYIAVMATITIRNLDENVKRNLRIRAARNGRSMEGEVRNLLERSVDNNSISVPARGANWVDEIIGRFQAVGGVDLELPARDIAEDSIDFSGPEFED